MDWKPNTSVSVSSPGVPRESGDDDSPETEDLTIPQLVSYLQFSYQKADFQTVERILQSRQESVRDEMERDFSEELAVKEVEKVELQFRCAALDRALMEEKDRHDALAAELTELERERSLFRKEAEKHRSVCGRLGTQITGLKGDYGTVREQVQGALENIAQYLEIQKDQILEVKKKRQEEERKLHGEIDDWKRKCADLEAQVRRLEEERGNVKSSETSKTLDDGENCRSRIKVQPFLKVEVGSKVPIVTIDISDSDEDIDVAGDAHQSSITVEVDQKNVGTEDDDEEYGICNMNFPSTRTPKRKCVSRVVTSDSENDEDLIPLSKLKQKKLEDVIGEDGGPIESSDNCFSGYHDIQESVTPTLRRLVLLRERDGTKSGAGGTSPRDSTPQNQSPIETSNRVLRKRANVWRKIEFSDVKGLVEDEVRGGKKVDADDVSESESEGESLGGFIVDGTESESNSDDAPEEEGGEEDEEGQCDSDVELDDVLAKIRRGKDTKNWEYEADMLSAFGKSPELCMKAVCALYRLQTSEEQSVKQSFVANRQGFSKFDAVRGSMLAEFLTDGDAYGPVKKTVEQLKEYDLKGLEHCFQLASRYSKQLFTIYQNKNDPNFGPY